MLTSTLDKIIAEKEEIYYRVETYKKQQFVIPGHLKQYFSESLLAAITEKNQSIQANCKDWLIDIHCSEGGNIKAGQPHIHDDSDFQRRVIVFEFPRHIVLMSFVADNLTPFFGIVIALRHDHCNLFRPRWA